ncbi:MAG: hypothetical protein QME52_00425 [Bacteroidota bacterium]|nr:hypothetical protein [Bacteroidota bacterium]
MSDLTKIIFSLLTMGILSNTPSHSQWIGDSTNESHISRGIQYVYNLSFDSAKTEFQTVTRLRPDHPAGHFFLAMIEWWRIITDMENTAHDDKFYRMLDKVIDLCEKRLDKDKNDLTGLFFKGGALGFQGRLYGNREDWLKAANCGREALPLVQKAYKLDPNNSDILLGIGIYNYYAAIIPEIYPWVKPLMLLIPKGDKVKGLTQLREASEKAKYANIEATYFLMQASQYFEGRYSQALELATKLHYQFPNNSLFHKYIGRANVSLGNWEEMHHVYLQIFDRAKKKQIGYDLSTEREANYYLGLYEMNSNKYTDALQYFYKSDELSRLLDKKEISGYMVLSNLKIGMIYDLQGKRNLAITQYKKILDMKDYQDSHKQAKQFLKTPFRSS